MLLYVEEFYRRGRVATLLETEGYDTRSVTQLDEVHGAVAEYLPDVILIDAHQGATQGPPSESDWSSSPSAKLTRDLRASELSRGTPIVLLSLFAVSESLVSQGLRCGANDFVSLSRDVELVARVRLRLEEKHKWDLVERLRRERDLARQEALIDPLTQIPNQRAVSIALERAAAEQKHFAVLYIDVDNLREINDTFGRDVGDQILCAIADEVKQGAVHGDWGGRHGGDEFVVLLSGATAEMAEAAAARYMERIDALSIPALSGRTVTASIGVAVSEGDGPTPAPTISQGVEDFPAATRLIFTIPAKGEKVEKTIPVDPSSEVNRAAAVHVEPPPDSKESPPSSGGVKAPPASDPVDEALKAGLDPPSERLAAARPSPVPIRARQTSDTAILEGPLPPVRSRSTSDTVELSMPMHTIPAGPPDEALAPLHTIPAGPPDPPDVADEDNTSPGVPQVAVSGSAEEAAVEPEPAEPAPAEPEPEPAAPGDRPRSITQRLPRTGAVTQRLPSPDSRTQRLSMGDSAAHISTAPASGPKLPPDAPPRVASESRTSAMFDEPSPPHVIKRSVFPTSFPSMFDGERRRVRVVSSIVIALFLIIGSIIAITIASQVGPR